MDVKGNIGTAWLWMLMLGIGTFARVWLVKLANPAEEDRDKVFALKVLRKVEGKLYSG